MLTHSGDIVEWQKEHFEDLINTSNMSIFEEADSGEDKSIAMAEIIVVVKSHPGGSMFR